MHKKILTLIVAAFFVASFSACGQTTSDSAADAETSEASDEGSVTETAENVDVAEDNTASATEIISGAAVGDEITFGSYEQDGDTSNGEEAIEWIVVKEEDGKKLLLSKYVLMDTQLDYSEDLFVEDIVMSDYTTYVSTFYVDWDEMPIRSYLNGEFLESAFSADEAALIVETENSTVADQYDADYNVISSDSVVTTDKVFLLSDDDLAGWSTSDDFGICKELVASATAASGVANETIDADYYKNFFDWSDEEWEANKENYPCGDFCAVMWRGTSTIQNSDGTYNELINVSSQYGQTGSWYSLGELTHSNAGKVGVRPAIWVSAE